VADRATAAVDWHRQPLDAALEGLRASPGGLTGREARERQAVHGPNLLREGPRRTALSLLAGQFTDFMILVLLAAAVVSGLIGDVVDTVAIVAIVALNAVIGFVQEYRAERAMAALKAMAAPTATVRRDGAVATIPTADLVPGDIVLLEAGRIVPADLRLLEAAHLRVEEAALTGESVPIEKTTAPLPGEALPVGDRTNMAFKGTTVTYGRGEGLVVATGMQTEFGRIAASLQEAEETRTPLQRRLMRFGQNLSFAVLAICGVVFAAGLARGEPPLQIFLVAVSLAVAAIPESLPAVVTISLALGARTMVAKQALVRRLPAVETRGSVTGICSGTSGSLRLNRMRVEAYYCEGVLRGAPERGGAWDELLLALALSNDAGQGPTGALVGDPTEVALLAAAREAGREKAELEPRFPRVGELPFDSERKRMTTVHRDAAGGFVAFTKGAAESVLACSENVCPPLLGVGERMAADGLRVLGGTRSRGGSATLSPYSAPGAPQRTAPTSDSAHRQACGRSVPSSA
jgi:Ca2+-transporting ATPase